ncbi:MAG: hypothetical protein P1V20_09500 [Verrucomicrobiales bacterium]|nr:hypothetical protein [Verrucomicrobiales bacterium]
MNKSTTILSRWTLAAALGLAFPALTGCVHHSLSHQALTFNKTVHDHRVEQLLLNVLRASHREPMALTAVTSLSTSNNRRLDLGPVSGTFGLLSTDTYNGSISGGVSASPNMAITILDDDPDFMRGFVKPVPVTTIRYFIEQGWNTELLSHLLIERIRNTGSDDLVNDPRHRDRYDQFVDAIHSNLRYLRLVDEEVKSTPHKVTTTSQTLIDGSTKTEVVTENAADLVIKEGGLHIQGSDAEVIMRSPQGVLYYLGELARIQLDDKEGVIPMIGSSGDEETPLFLIERGGDGKSKHSVNYHGASYRIPSKPENRSLQALAFVQQLINLQTKTIAPPPSTLRLVTQ